MSERPRASVETLPGSELLPWAVDAGGGFLQGPLDLAFVAGRRLDLALGHGMVALLAREGEVAATFLPGRHLLQVREPGGRTTVLESARAATAAGELPQDGALLFLSTGSDIELRWPDSPASPVPAGECALRVAAPVAFYATFLSRAERIGEEFVRKLLTTLVLERTRVLLAGGRPAGQIRPEDLAAVLGPMGVACRSLRLGPARAETPGGMPAGAATVAVDAAAPNAAAR